MSLRVTNNSMVRNYNTALSSSLGSLNRSREKVYSGKQFTRAYQDPTGALRVAELRRKSDKIDGYLSTLTTAQKRQDTADAALQQIVGTISNTVNDEGLQAINGTNLTDDIRKTYTTLLRERQNSLLQSANTKYGESYLFCGADGDNIPFKKDANGNITYRGMNINDPDITKYLDEKLYMDLGMGLQVDTADGIANSSNDINGASAFNAAICGLKTFGYGIVPNSNPPISRNAIQLLGQMADELESPNFDPDRFNQMRDQLTKTHSEMADYNANIGVRSDFLTNTEERLKDEQLNIIKQTDAIETAQPADAITEYSYAQYIHNLVLKVGTSLLTNSFIDFMK